jgi:DNA-binding response OmpR family regulator
VLYAPNTEVRQAFAQLLQTEGWSTLECEQASDALRAARSGRTIDALLVDLKTGIAVADEVRREQPGVRVLFLSGQDEPPPATRGGFVKRALDFRLVESLLKATPSSGSRRNTA